MPVIEKFLCTPLSFLQSLLHGQRHKALNAMRAHSLERRRFSGSRADPQTGPAGVKSKVGLGRQERHLIRNTFTPRNVAKLRARPARVLFVLSAAVSFVLVARNEGHDLLITRVSLSWSSAVRVSLFHRVRLSCDENRLFWRKKYESLSRSISRSSEKKSGYDTDVTSWMTYVTSWIIHKSSSGLQDLQSARFLCLGAVRNLRTLAEFRVSCWSTFHRRNKLLYPLSGGWCENVMWKICELC